MNQENSKLQLGRAEADVNDLAWRLSALVFDVNRLIKDFAKLNTFVVDIQTRIIDLESKSRKIETE